MSDFGFLWLKLSFTFTDEITWGDFVAIMKPKKISWMYYSVLATIEFQKLNLSLHSDNMKVH